MHPRFVILLSLLGFTVLIAGVSFWCIAKWQATPVAHPIVAPVKMAPVPKPMETPIQEPTVVPGVTGKINIDEVCQGALAYMTFVDAASADAFVERCKAGKHPEVIEQYKANLNLGTDVAI